MSADCASHTGRDIAVEIESLAPGGDGVGRQCPPPGQPPGSDPSEGRVTFVPLAAPGERVSARLEREKGKVAWAELTGVERPGPDRVPPRCPLFGTCGGCQWQHVRSEAQQAAKRTIVARALGVDVPPVVAASPAYGYRDRAKLAVGPGGVLGFRARRSHALVDLAGAAALAPAMAASPHLVPAACPLFGPELARALPALRALARGLAADVELEVQAGAEGVHVHVSHADLTSAAHARREVDRLAAAGVVGLTIAGLPTMSWGLAEVDVAEPGSPRLALPAGGFAQVGRAANAALGRRRARSRGTDPGGGAGALRRKRKLHPPSGRRRQGRVRLRRRSGGGGPRASETFPGRPGIDVPTRLPPTPSSSIHLATAPTEPISPPRVAPAAEWSTFLATPRRSVATRAPWCPPDFASPAPWLSTSCPRPSMWRWSRPSTVLKFAACATATGARWCAVCEGGGEGERSAPRRLARSGHPPAFLEAARAWTRRNAESGALALDLLAVACIFVLVGVILAVGVRRHIVSVRQAEAESMLLELATREQAFRAQNGRYLPLRADAHTDVPSRDEDPEAFYPQPADSPRLASARRPTRIEDRSLWPAGWRTVAVRPKTDLPYCTYLVNAGQGGRPEPEMTYGAALLPTEVPGPWFYALAACNFSGWARFPRGVTVYGLSSEALVPRAFDVGQ